MQNRILRHHRINKESGLSFFELVISITLYTLFIVGLAAAVILTTRATNHAEQIEAGRAYAKGVIEEVRASHPRASKAPSTEEWKAVSGGYDFDIKKEISLFDSDPSYKRIMVTITVKWLTKLNYQKELKICELMEE